MADEVTTTDGAGQQSNAGPEGAAAGAGAVTTEGNDKGGGAGAQEESKSDRVEWPEDAKTYIANLKNDRETARAAAKAAEEKAKTAEDAAKETETLRTENATLKASVRTSNNSRAFADALKAAGLTGGANLLVRAYGTELAAEEFDAAKLVAEAKKDNADLFNTQRGSADAGPESTTNTEADAERKLRAAIRGRQSL